MREKRCSEIHGDNDFKDGNPGTACLVQKRGDRATKNGTQPLRGVQEAVIGRGVLRPVGICQRRWKERENLAPAEEHHTGHNHKCGSVRPGRQPDRHCEPLQGEGNYIVFSRPIWSDTQPKNGRVRPLANRSIDSARGRAGKPKTKTSAMPKSRGNAPICETTMRPPVDIMALMTNLSQKTGGLRSLAGGNMR